MMIAELAHLLMYSFVPSSIGENDAHWNRPFDHLRKKWSEVPKTEKFRVQVDELHKLSDEDLLCYWDENYQSNVSDANIHFKKWYHLLYEPLFKGKWVIDYGSGLGWDAFTTASVAGKVTCVDIVPENLLLLERISKLKKMNNMKFIHLSSLEDFNKLGTDFDVLMAMGSLHHAPMRVAQHEIAELSSRLKMGGRWLQLTYPYKRWVRDGRMPFCKWGEWTDGKGTPWAEWYDAEKLKKCFGKSHFKKIMEFNFYNDAFNWFDFMKIS